MVKRSSRFIRFFGGAIVLAGVLLFLAMIVVTWPWFKKESSPEVQHTLTTFASCAALSEYVQTAQNERPMYMLGRESAIVAPTAGDSASQQKTADYSATNIQVAGVDEPDLVKTDGSFFYVVNTEGLTIGAVDKTVGVAAASHTKLGITPTELFLDGDRLVIFGSIEQAVISGREDQGIAFPRYGMLFAGQVWDVRDRTNPRLVKQFELEGSYVTARLINHRVTLVVSAYPRYETPSEDGDILPLYRESTKESASGSYAPAVRCADVVYPPDMFPEQFVILGSFDMTQAEPEIRKEVFLGSSQNVYASQNTLYLAGTEYSRTIAGRLLPSLPVGSTESTSVQIFDFKNNGIAYRGKLTAPGHVLNQFSMDEHEGVFRIATTKGQASREGLGTTNNLYFFNNGLQQIGALEDLAPGETIYSARFLGDRIYLVTFQKVDPLFVVDASDPTKPVVLGKLKIPGYSDYLHPYDETHLIGIGKDAVPSEEGNFSWYQGIKMALFDVSDPAKPKELHSTLVGDRGTDSYALHDHKAFLFSRSKNLLVLPILLATIPDAQKKEDAPTTYGDFVYQGAFVFSLTLEGGFTEKGRITHLTDDTSLEKSGYDYPNDGASVQRSLYVDDVLYTISQTMIKANDLANMNELGSISLCDGSCEARPPILY